MHKCVCSNQCKKKGWLCCKSSCHGCSALHRRAGPVAPRDNHSLAEGHLFSPNLISNHMQSVYSSPQSFVSAARRVVHGDTRRAMCMLHTGRAHLWFIPDSLKSFCCFSNSWLLNSFCQCGWNSYVFFFMCVSSFSSLYVTYVYNLINSLFSGASLRPAPARRLFLREKFLI